MLQSGIVLTSPNGSPIREQQGRNKEATEFRRQAKTAAAVLETAGSRL